MAVIQGGSASVQRTINRIGASDGRKSQKHVSVRETTTTSSEDEEQTATRRTGSACESLACTASNSQRSTAKTRADRVCAGRSRRLGAQRAQGRGRPYTRGCNRHQQFWLLRPGSDRRAKQRARRRGTRRGGQAFGPLPHTLHPRRPSYPLGAP